MVVINLRSFYNVKKVDHDNMFDDVYSCDWSRNVSERSDSYLFSFSFLGILSTFHLFCLMQIWETKY